MEKSAANGLHLNVRITLPPSISLCWIQGLCCWLPELHALIFLCLMDLQCLWSVRCGETIQAPTCWACGSEAIPSETSGSFCPLPSSFLIVLLNSLQLVYATNGVRVAWFAGCDMENNLFPCPCGERLEGQGAVRNVEWGAE